MAPLPGGGEKVLILNLSHSVKGFLWSILTRVEPCFQKKMVMSGLGNSQPATVQCWARLQAFGFIPERSSLLESAVGKQAWKEIRAMLPSQTEQPQEELLGGWGGNSSCRVVRWECSEKTRECAYPYEYLTKLNAMKLRKSMDFEVLFIC